MAGEQIQYSGFLFWDSMFGPGVSEYPPAVSPFKEGSFFCREGFVHWMPEYYFGRNAVKELLFGKAPKKVRVTIEFVNE